MLTPTVYSQSIFVKMPSSALLVPRVDRRSDTGAGDTFSRNLPSSSVLDSESSLRRCGVYGPLGSDRVSELVRRGID